MAGSLNHVLGGWSMIENMGDAHEAVEELLWLVLSEIGEEKAEILLNEKYYPMSRGELKRSLSFDRVKTLMDS